MIEFQSPAVLMLLLFIPVLWFLRIGRRAALPFSDLNGAAPANASVRAALVGLPKILRMLVVLLLIIAAARPRKGIEQVLQRTQGIAIQMVIDRSGSMGAEMRYGNEALTRLDVVKRLFREFVNGDGEDLSGRVGDLVGMIVFAREAVTVCPMTLSHDLLGRLLQTVQLAKDRSEDGTAIGDAIALAVARLQMVEETLSKQDSEQPHYTITSKIILLLTDGQNNAGARSPNEAAGLARDHGIKIYAIGVGEHERIGRRGGLLGEFLLQLGDGVDKAALQRIAEITGGRFFMAADGEALKAVYEEIDVLERSEIHSVRWTSYRELFAGFVIAALILLSAEVLLKTTWLRTIP